jgi:hypothetical protein
MQKMKKKKKRRGGVEKILCIPPRGGKKKLISILQPGRDFFSPRLTEGSSPVSKLLTAWDWRQNIPAERAIVISS